MIGRLRQRVQVMAITEVEEAGGGRLSTDTLLATVWAEVRHAEPGGDEALGRERLRRRVTVRLRQRADVVRGVVLVHAGARYRVLAVRPDADAPHILHLTAEEELR